MSKLVWDVKYSVYPFTIEDKKGQIRVYDKGGTDILYQGQIIHFKNFQKAMQYVTLNLNK